MYPRTISYHSSLFLFSYRTEVFNVCFTDTQTVDIHCVMSTDCRAKKANLTVLITNIGSTCAPGT